MSADALPAVRVDRRRASRCRSARATRCSSRRPRAPSRATTQRVAGLRPRHHAAPPRSPGSPCTWARRSAPSRSTGQLHRRRLRHGGQRLRTAFAFTTVPPTIVIDRSAGRRRPRPRPAPPSPAAPPPPTCIRRSAPSRSVSVGGVPTGTRPVRLDGQLATRPSRRARARWAASGAAVSITVLVAARSRRHR